MFHMLFTCLAREQYLVPQPEKVQMANCLWLKLLVTVCVCVYVCVCVRARVRYWHKVSKTLDRKSLDNSSGY